MLEPLIITCPFCGEQFALGYDDTEGQAEFVVDCEICCRPMTVTLYVRSGEAEVVSVRPD